MLFRMIYDDKLAQAAYLIGCQQTGEALVIDPERDVDRYIDLASREHLRITAITETHIHADFLSGARELAERTGAKLYLSDEGDADWKYQWLDKRRGGGIYDHVLLHDGDTFRIGNIEITAVHTPGHTPEHLSFMVTDHGGGASEPIGIATGDFVFVGDVGRPDLLETAAGTVGAKEPSARRLYDSLQRFIELPDYLQVWPAHGAGSACGKALGAVPQSTVGYEKRFNPAVADARGGREEFVEAIIADQPEPPMYFARMKRDNKLGPAILNGVPEPGRMDVHELARVAEDRPKNVVIDTRRWDDFARGHVPGALYSPLNKSFPTTAGSYVAEDQNIYLVAEEKRIHEAVVDLIRIGLDAIGGYVTPDDMDRYLEEDHPRETTASMTIGEFIAEKGHPRDGVVLDVRNESEWRRGHLADAILAPHTRLVERVASLPLDRKLYVHCQTGARSAVASAMLQRNGFDVVYLSGGGYPELEGAGLNVERDSADARVTV